MNQVILSGRVVFDPEVKHFGKKKAVVLVVATNRYAYKDPETKKWVEEVDFHRVVGKSKFHALMSRFRKGDSIVVRGQLVHRRWRAPDGKAWRSAANIWPQQIEKPLNRGDTFKAPLVDPEGMTMDEWMADLDGI